MTARTSFFLGIGYIITWAFQAAIKIGSFSSPSTEPFSVFDAIMIVVSFTIPFVLGYQAGKEE